MVIPQTGEPHSPYMIPCRTVLFFTAGTAILTLLVSSVQVSYLLHLTSSLRAVQITNNRILRKTEKCLKKLKKLKKPKSNTIPPPPDFTPALPEEFFKSLNY